MNEKWRFPPSNHGSKKGISDGNIETFKKTPYKSFAREILQNSIDARLSDEEPVIVEFNSFTMKTSDIPDRDGLIKAAKNCEKLWSYQADCTNFYKDVEKELNKKEIICLRISDYNTTGLIGVNSNKQEKNNFLALTKGTGISEKSSDIAGGSKGVGKNAAFLMSSIRTVFYSTLTSDQDDNIECYGSIGVAEFISGSINDETDDYTQGTGFFSADEYNSPLNHILSFDKEQKKRGKTGTDIFIFGFLNDEDWEKEIINSILDSFIAAIYYKCLVVIVNGKKISSETLYSIVSNDNIIAKNQKSNIISQYKLLSNFDNNVGIYEIETEYGGCELHILQYKKNEETLATHKCSMIRIPYMKIKDEFLFSSYTISALCIIKDNALGKKLRNIENPQHIDWEPNRLKTKEEKKEIENVIKDIKKQIKEKAMEYLKVDELSSIDPMGIGNFLPNSDFLGDNKNGQKPYQFPNEDVVVSKPKDNITFERNNSQSNKDSNSLKPDIGEVDNTCEGIVQHPYGENNTVGNGRHPGSETSGEKDGNNVIFKRAPLSGVKYKVISINKFGKIRIIFISPTDYNNCYLSISMLDDTNSSSPIAIKSMECNKHTIIGSNPYEYGPFAIKINEKIILDIEIDESGYFGSEVKVICK